MAVKSRASQKSIATAPVEQVKALVRPNLGYDGETWHTPRSIGRILCLHGTRIDSIERLAVDGRFSGEISDLQGQFYTVPNPRFRGWNRFVVKHGLDVVDEGYDALESAIAYAETSDAQAARRCSKQEKVDYDDHGIVVAFNGSVPEQDMELYEDPLEQEYELIFPHPPSLGAIEGIYPIDRESANFLAHALERIK